MLLLITELKFRLHFTYYSVWIWYMSPNNNRLFITVQKNYTKIGRCVWILSTSWSSFPLSPKQWTISSLASAQTRHSWLVNTARSSSLSKLLLSPSFCQSEPFTELSSLIMKFYKPRKKCWHIICYKQFWTFQPSHLNPVRYTELLLYWSSIAWDME